MNYAYHDAFSSSHFGYGYTEYDELLQRHNANIPLAEAQARIEPDVTTWSELRRVLAKAVRYAGTDSNITATNYFSQALLSIESERDSRGTVRQAISVFQNGNRQRNIDPSVTATEFLKAMEAAGKFKYDQINPTGGSGTVSARPRVAQADAQYQQALENMGRPEEFSLAEWWASNKKWVVPTVGGIGLLIGIGLFMKNQKSKSSKSAPSTFKPRRRRRL